MANEAFDKRAIALGYCCGYAFIRMNLLPTDSINKLHKKLGVSRACFVRNRKKVREGLVKCEKRNTCLRACWLND